jgi:ATP-dependent exoDNAse (exonuclease V) beta subunit
MSDAVRAPDQAERSRALDPSRSFIVQAPAGSGKTELLIQRFLALLGRVDRPEEIAAITFTIKAAAEMRLRVFDALRAARREPRPAAAHEASTWDLARAALARNDALGWKLEESAERLRVQTIDALCMSLTRQMPVLSQFGGQPDIIEDASLLYAEAARNLVAAVENPDHPGADCVATLLTHLDNDAGQAEKLIAVMLAQRDRWVRMLAHTKDRAALEATLDSVRGAAVDRARALWPANLMAPKAGDVDGWITHAKAMLTKEGDWRARGVPEVLKGIAELHAALCQVQRLPPGRYDDDQWNVLDAIIHLAPLAIAELRVVFARERKADFIEMGQGALRALQGEDGPTDLLLVLDYRIRHILVDEFQDTSFTQFDLLKLLTSGWEEGDGRTLFVVGDPMQSIYRFREAEVGLFLEAWHHGIGSVSLEPLTLSANFRSQAGIVDWVNTAFARVMPESEDIHGGAVTYSPSQAVHEREAEAVRVHPFFDADAVGEGRHIARIAGEAIGQGQSVAILVRNRSHLQEIMPRLREAKLKFRAVEIESLGHRPAVQDLLALTRALAHLADRPAWLAVLRAPWCGLTLADLVALAPDDGVTVWESMGDASRVARLDADGRRRLERTRAVLAGSLESRRRASLRDSVEGAWLALGGPACVADATDLEDAQIYLDHLESVEDAGALRDLNAFETSVADLFALPDLAAPDCLQVMTIHKAKGLEFDCVIVPGLASGTGSDDRSLFMWMETPESHLLLAPINATGTKDDLIFELIRGLDKRKSDHENGRLLYVAATRARKRLHLFGDVKRDHDGTPKDPPGKSLLAKLWCVVAPDFAIPGVRRVATSNAPAVPAAKQGELRRLAIDSLAYEAPPPVQWQAPPEKAGYDEIEFSWVGDTARRVGSVVHRWLQRIADDEAKGWSRARVEKERAAIANELAARGVVEADIGKAADRVIAALATALDDPRGRWLLGPQQNARNEYRLSTVVDGVRRVLVIDRMFEDLAGAWIVDYKTSSHEGADLEGFLDGEKTRYRDQLERYAAAAARLNARRGLYFPLLKGWREWTSDERNES